MENTASSQRPASHDGNDHDMITRNGSHLTSASSDSEHTKVPDEQDNGHLPVPPFSPPPYSLARARGDSTMSNVSIRRRSGPIRLTDNTDIETSEQSRACWAQSACIDNYIVISGGAKNAGLGSYVVWNCTIVTLNAAGLLGHGSEGGSFKIRRRYSEFEKLRANLVRTFPYAGAALPEIPPKSIFHRFEAKFLEKRRVGLAHFLHCVLLNPEFSGSPVVKEFLFD